MHANVKKLATPMQRDAFWMFLGRFLMFFFEVGVRYLFWSFFYSVFHSSRRLDSNTQESVVTTNQISHLLSKIFRRFHWIENINSDRLVWEIWAHSTVWSRRYAVLKFTSENGSAMKNPIWSWKQDHGVSSVYGPFPGPRRLRGMPRKCLGGFHPKRPKCV